MTDRLAKQITDNIHHDALAGIHPARASDTIRADDMPQTIREWIRQLAEDRLLHRIVALVEENGDQADLEVTAILRGSQGHAVLEPKITIRR